MEAGMEVLTNGTLGLTMLYLMGVVFTAKPKNIVHAIFAKLFPILLTTGLFLVLLVENGLFKAKF